MTPYLFLIVRKVLNYVIKKTMSEGRLQGVKLPGGKHQCISQYGDDSSFLIQDEKPCMDELVRLLEVFSRAFGMEINWHKSCAYWIDRLTPKPTWLKQYNWPWAEENKLSKLLGTPFGLNLQILDVYQFLIKKISKN